MLNVAQIRRDKCSLCGQDASTEVDSTLLSHGHEAAPILTQCARCGNFSITWEALEELDRLGATVAISGIAREWFESNRPLEINKDNLRSLINFAQTTYQREKTQTPPKSGAKYPRLNQNCYIDQAR